MRSYVAQTLAEYRAEMIRKGPGGVTRVARVRQEHGANRARLKPEFRVCGVLQSVNLLQ